MKVYLVQDEWQYDGGCAVLGIYDDANQALILQQKFRREESASLSKSSVYSLGSRRLELRLESINIIEVNLNEDLSAS